MADSTLLSRISEWFAGSKSNGELPIMREIHDDHADRSNGGSNGNTSIEPRGSFLRPWARQEAVINQLHTGFTTLTDLMAGIRENLDRQNQRQDELLQVLAHLPQAIETLPESARVHGETLKAIHQQLGSQNLQQEKLAEILHKLSDGGHEQREMLDGLQERIESMRQTDQAIADNLSSVGVAMQSVGKSSSTTTQVLEQMRDNVNSRDGQLERILQRQGQRFTAMLAIAIFLSIAALAAVSVFGYLLLHRAS